jgi:hypothetical protein
MKVSGSSCSLMLKRRALSEAFEKQTVNVEQSNALKDNIEKAGTYCETGWRS